MENKGPDLIERAAARFQQDRGDALAQAEPIVRDRARALPESWVPVEAIGKVSRSVEPPLPKSERHVTISAAGLAANGIALPSGGFSRTAEEFRALKHNVLSNAMRGGDGAGSATRRIILVTSARAGEGKTFTSTNLALALACEKDTRVLLMDADAHRQSLMECLGISSDTGWLDVVSGASVPVGSAVLATNIAGLSVLPTGKERTGIPELMASSQMKNLLSQLVREDPARYIIVDALPCLTSTEPSVLAGLAGQTLFVVAAHKTSREDIECSLRLLNGSPSVGLVLNKAEPLLTEQFKGYGYAYAYPR